VNERLKEILGADYLVDRWVKTPIPEFSGFSIQELRELGFHERLVEWFDSISDERIKQISKTRRLSWQR
jgi:hypothetical protein